MADTLVSTALVYVNGGGSTVYGTVPAPSSTSIDRAREAIARMIVDIDSFLPGGRVDIYFVSAAFMKSVPKSAGGPWKSETGGVPYGYTPRRGKAFVRNDLGSETTEDVVLHEIRHTIQKDKLDHAARVAIAELMTPDVDTSVDGFWTAGKATARPSEVDADTFPLAYSDIRDVLAYYWDRDIVPANFAAYRAASGGSGAPASTTLATASLVGDTDLDFTSAGAFSVGDWFTVGVDPDDETRQIGGKTSSNVTFDEPLTIAHALHAPVVETDGPPDVIDGAIEYVLTQNIPNGNVASHTFRNRPLGERGQAKMQFFDGKAWGDFGEPVDYSIDVDPGKPIVKIQFVGPTADDYVFNVSIENSPDPFDYIKDYTALVYQQIAGGQNRLMMQVVVHDVPGLQRTVSIPYQGNQGGSMAFGQTYQVGIGIINSYGIGEFSGYQTFTPAVDVGPIITPNDPAVKLDTTEPTYTLAHRLGTNITQARLRLRDVTKTVVLWESEIETFAAAASHGIAVPAGILTQGMDFFVEGEVTADGETNLGATSTPFVQHVNAQPGAPAPVTLPGDAGAQTIQRADGVWVTTAAQPTTSYPFRDTDADAGFTEYPTVRDVEIRTDAGALLVEAVRPLPAADLSVQTPQGAMLESFAKVGSASASDAGWVAGGHASVDYSADGKATHITLTALPSGSVSTQRHAAALSDGTLYTDLSGITQIRRVVRVVSSTTLPPGLSIVDRFTFSGDPANYAEFDVTPAMNNVGEEVISVLASPDATGGVVDWSEVTGYETDTSHTAGVNRSYSYYLSKLRADYATLEEITRHRARYADTGHSFSELSELARIKLTALPTLSSVTPADGVVMTDPTPRWAGIYAHTGGMPLYGVQVLLALDGLPYYNSGIVPTEADSSGAFEFVLGVGILDTDQKIDWELRAYTTDMAADGSDGIHATALGSFTTEFAVPDTITGLVVVPDVVNDGLLVMFDTPNLPADEYISTGVDVRPTGGQWRRAVTFTDQTVNSTIIRAAPHNAEMLVRVVQSNGWAESVPAEASATLGGERDSADFLRGDYLIRPEAVVQLPTADTALRGRTSHGSGDTQASQEVFTPPMRPYKVVIHRPSKGYETTLSLLTRDRELIELLRSWKDDGLVSIWKTSDGDVRYVLITSVPDVRQPGWWNDAEISLMEVGPDGVEF